MQADEAEKNEADSEWTADKNASASDQSHRLGYISKHLIKFVPTETAVRISGARVLTIEKCVAILKEHEEKWKQEEEEKERERKI